jgi:hypothetical protein
MQMSMFDFAKQEENEQGFIYTDAQLMSRLKFFIGICLALTLTGIVFVVLYSLIFVTQPLNAISPIDQKFFELIIPIATFLTGTLSGIMLAGDDPVAKSKALETASKGWDKPQAPITIQNTPSPYIPPVSGSFGSGPTNFGTAESHTPPPTPDFTPQILTVNGKPAPYQPPHPEI